MAGEFEFIEWVRSQACAAGDDRGVVVVPSGDDLAALRWAADDLLLVGADQVLDGVHFDSAVHPPRLIGRKVMNRNLSDCAAMACLPAAAVATAALPRGVGLDYAKELYLGMSEAGGAFKCPVVGGDTATWGGRLAVTVTVLGRSAGIKPLVRSGARPGDGIYVTGPLGGSILGRHMTFEPRVDVARKLASLGSITAMIDLSDGLSRDLGHVCRQSGVGAVVAASQVPVHEDAIAMRRDGRSALDHALHDGEDYELLFTGPPGFYFASTRVGTVTAEPGVWLRTGATTREPLEPGGWEHRL
jgi:thiamine-monophosphate kinase